MRCVTFVQPSLYDAEKKEGSRDFWGDYTFNDQSTPPE